MKLIPYINLTGNAEEALNFYKDVFGGAVEIMRWKDMPPDPKMPVDEAWHEKVMHGSLTISEDLMVYAADSLQDGEGTVGNNVFIHVEFDSEDELRKAYEVLAVGGKVNMPVDQMFWGAIYGDLVDKFGVGWGFHYQLPSDA